MKEIFITASDTDDHRSTVKASMSSLVRDSARSGAPLLVFDNGSNQEFMSALIDELKAEKYAGATVFTGDPDVSGFEGVEVIRPTTKNLQDMKLPAQFILISGSSSYLMKRGKEWKGYQNQPEVTRQALETLTRIRRLFFQ